MYKITLKYFSLTLITLSLVYCKSKKESSKKEELIPLRGDKTNDASELMFASLYIDGCAARMKGNVNEALKIFNQCLKYNPNSIPLKYELATVNKILGINDLALAYAKECAAAEPKNYWYQLILADCYRALKQFNNSVKVQEQLEKNFPDNYEFKENLAIEYSIIGQFDKSYSLYNELEKKYGINEQITINKIKILNQENKQDEIEKEINRLISSSPDNPTYLTYLAEHYENIKKPEKAKEVYNKIIEIDPRNPTVHLALSDYYKLKGNDAQAFEELKMAFSNPDLDVQTKYGINLLYYDAALNYPESPYYTQGMELAKLMVKVHPSASEANGIYADFLFLNKRYSEAADFYYRSALKDKSDFKTWEKLLICNKKLVRYDSLEKHSFEALELFPNHALIYYYNGLANMQLRNYKKAIQSFNDGMEFIVDDKFMLSGFYSNLGDAYYYTQDFEKSDKAFDDALKINSDNETVLNNYAYYLGQRKIQLDKAEKLAKRCIELKPNEANYMDTYGWILYLQAKYAVAEPWLLKASQLNPGNPNILEHYGDCLAMLKKTNEAISAWEEAIKAGGNAERISKKIKNKGINE